MFISNMQINNIIPSRRNDTIIAPKVTSLPKGQAVTLTGDPSRYNAAVLEYTKVRVTQQGRRL